MKYLGLVLAVALFVISGFPQSSASVTAKRAKLRGTPSADGKVVDSLPRETELAVIERKDNWLLVQSREYVGWIYADDVEVKMAIAVEPAALQRPTATSVVIAPVTPVVSDRSPSTQGQVPMAPTVAAAETKATAKCKDGTFSYAIEREGRCSGHGGVSEWLDGEEPTQSTPVPSSRTVQVKGYYRKDGTYVKPHTRSAPRRKP